MYCIVAYTAEPYKEVIGDDYEVGLIAEHDEEMPPVALPIGSTAHPLSTLAGLHRIHAAWCLGHCRSLG